MPWPDLCGVLHPSTYDDEACINATIEIKMLDYNVAVRSMDGAYPGTYVPRMACQRSMDNV